MISLKIIIKSAHLHIYKIGSDNLSVRYTFLNLSQGNSCCFLLFTFQTLFTDLADCSCRCNQYHLRICRVTDLVIQAACTHRFTDDCIR